MTPFDVIILGAGAAGLMCAQTAGHRGRKVLVLDHANKPGKKILLSGGGRCNFTHRHATPSYYLSHNPHFAISALKRYSALDFERLVQKHQIPYHEKTLGQLFCDRSSQDILNLLLKECEAARVNIQLNTHLISIQKLNPSSTAQHFILDTSQGRFSATSLVIATGGLSFPTMGASPLGYHLAEQFAIPIYPIKAALVPLTLHTHDLERFAPLSGLSLEVIASCNGQSFCDALLFTHRGLSGPAILQISSYWEPGDILTLNFLPQLDLLSYLKAQKHTRPKASLKTLLSERLPARLAELLCSDPKPISDWRDTALSQLAQQLQKFEIKPNGTEGYRTAEVTLGGIDTQAISSKTFESFSTPHLYFIGEVLDVTGHLGGFNFQWAWSSGVCCGQVV